MEDEREFSSLRQKLKSTICFSCCFSRHDVLESTSSSSSSKPRLARSSSSTATWLKSTGRDFPEIKEKCRNLISRIGRNHNHHRRNSADFKYDPLSYALNFDEGFDCDEDVELPLRNFSARLPASPPPERAAAVPVVQRPVVCV